MGSARTKVLDMGCGWGPFLKSLCKRAENRLAREVTLYRRLRQPPVFRNGLNVEVKLSTDAWPITAPSILFPVGGHFCSIEQWQAGKQDQVYADFF
jgi:cyclopropane-fatty-acyl-phospholipid synthase